MSIERFVFTSHQKHSELQKMRRLNGVSNYAESSPEKYVTINMSLVEKRRHAEELLEAAKFNEEWELLQ